MKKYILPFTLCINWLAVCNALHFSPRDSDESAPTASHSIELKTRSPFIGRNLIGRDIIRKDGIRARSVLSDQPQEAGPLTYNPSTLFVTIDIAVGEGKYAVALDTAHSNTWVGADPANPYLPSNSSTNTGQNVTLMYNFGLLFTGTEFTDRMELPGVNFSFIQSFGSANMSNFDGFDGVLGIGMPAQTVGTLNPNESQIIPTVTDTMVTNDIIPKNLTCISLSPLTVERPGRLDFGGINHDGLTSDVKFVPNANTSIFNQQLWAVNVSIGYGDRNETVTLLEEGPCIIDTTQPLISLPNEAFHKYVELVGAVIDESMGIATINDTTHLQSLFFQIGDVEYEFISDAQLWPRMFNPDGEENVTILTISDSAADVSESCSFGLAFVERFYVVLDGDTPAVGFAETNFTRAIVNG